MKQSSLACLNLIIFVQWNLHSSHFNFTLEPELGRVAPSRTDIQASPTGSHFTFASAASRQAAQTIASPGLLQRNAVPTPWPELCGRVVSKQVK